MKTLVILSITLLQGCASLSYPTHFMPAESVYQGLSAYDMGQTVSISRQSQCFKETGWPTAELIGDHPSQSGVEKYFAATATLHYLVSNWLDRVVDATDSRASKVARAVWYAGSIGLEASAVLHNAKDGIRPFQGANGCGPAQRAAHQK